jgi:hypothetical protein
MASEVVVALVVVLLVMMASVRVDEAVEMKPSKNARVVEVAFSPVPRVVNGKEKEVELSSLAQSQSLVPVFLRICPLAQVRPSGRISPEKERLPLAVTLPDEVALIEETFWRVVEPRARKLVAYRLVEVALVIVP